MKAGKSIPQIWKIKFGSDVYSRMQTSAHISHYLSEWQSWHTFWCSFFPPVAFIHLHDLKNSHSATVVQMPNQSQAIRWTNTDSARKHTLQILFLQNMIKLGFESKMFCNSWCLETSVNEQKTFLLHINLMFYFYRVCAWMLKLNSNLLRHF